MMLLTSDLWKATGITLLWLTQKLKFTKEAWLTKRVKCFASFLSFVRVLLTSVILNRWINLDCHSLNQLHRLQSWWSWPPSIRQPGCRLARWWFRSPQLGRLAQASERDLSLASNFKLVFSCSFRLPVLALILVVVFLFSSKQIYTNF